MNYVTKVEYEPAPESTDASTPVNDLFDATAEAALLATFIRDPSHRAVIRRVIDDSSFGHEGHRRLWSIADHMTKADHAVDSTRLVQEALRAGIPMHREGLETLLGHYSAGSPDVHVERVRGGKHRRQIAAAGQRLLSSARNSQRDPLAEAMEVGTELCDFARRERRRTDEDDGFESFAERGEKMKSGQIRNISWPGAPVLTRSVRALESQSITLLAGSPGDGKSFWILQSLLDWLREGVRACVCMLEKRKNWHLFRVLAILEGDGKFKNADWVQANKDEFDEAKLRNERTLRMVGAAIHESANTGETLEDIASWIDRQSDENDVIVVDPISLAEVGKNRWLADQRFIKSCIRTTERTDGRIVLVTHPNGNDTLKGLQSIMGGLAYQRATDSVLHVEKLKEPKRFTIERELAGLPVRDRVTANRIVSVFKGRNAEKSAAKFAFYFDHTLRYAEQGAILRDPKGDTETVDEAIANATPFHETMRYGT